MSLTSSKNYQDQSDDESFIVLETCPDLIAESSCDTFPVQQSNTNTHLDDALEDMCEGVSLAFKSHFQQGDGPSAESLMTATEIVTNNKTLEELQRSFGEILDENMILKETLKQNNDSMRDQLLLIASCQEDMMKTHSIHQEKFEETRDLVEKLRQENKALKQRLLVQQNDCESTKSEYKTAKSSGPPSLVEFVSSPDDDTINKLTAQLELVEKQRRQLVLENSKLTWQKESLEHMIDVTSKERDELRDKCNNMETSVCEEKAKSNSKLEQMEAKVTSLQQELAQAKVKILELESLRLELSRVKADYSAMKRSYKDQVLDLTERLRDAHTTVFQPIRTSVTVDCSDGSVEYANYLTNLNTYDKTLKHLGDFLNGISQGMVDCLLDAMESLSNLNAFKLDKTTADEFKHGLVHVKKNLEKLQGKVLNNVAQIQGMLEIFEGIFNDYNEVLKKSVDIQLEITRQKMENSDLKNEYEMKIQTLICKLHPQTASRTTQLSESPSPDIEALTNALLARSEEVHTLSEKVRNHTDEVAILKTQVELYKSDFDMEREARQRLACEKDNLEFALRDSERKYEKLLTQLDKVAKEVPELSRRLRIHGPILQSPVAQFADGSLSSSTIGQSHGATAQSHAATGQRVHTNGQSRPHTASGQPNHPPLARLQPQNAVKKEYTCPKCLRFKSTVYSEMEDHFDFCLDDF